MKWAKLAVGLTARERTSDHSARPESLRRHTRLSRSSRSSPVTREAAQVRAAPACELQCVEPSGSNSTAPRGRPRLTTARKAGRAGARGESARVRGGSFVSVSERMTPHPRQTLMRPSEPSQGNRARRRYAQTKRTDEGHGPAFSRRPRRQSPPRGCCSTPGARISPARRARDAAGADATPHGAGPTLPPRLRAATAAPRRPP